MSRTKNAGRSERQTVALSPTEAERLAALARDLGVPVATAGRLAMLAGLGLIEGERRAMEGLAEAVDGSRESILAALGGTDKAMRKALEAIYVALVKK